MPGALAIDAQENHAWGSGNRCSAGSCLGALAMNAHECHDRALPIDARKSHVWGSGNRC